MTKMGLPPFDVPPPFQPARGWVAVSSRALRFGDLFHETYPQGAFAWLGAYQPVARLLRKAPQAGNKSLYMTRIQSVC